MAAVFHGDHVPKLGGHLADFAQLSAFVCAVQAASLGDDKTARRIWKRFAADREGWYQGYANEDDLKQELADPRMLLGECIVGHLRNGLLQDKADWKRIHTRMGSLFHEFPQLNSDWCGDLYRDLAATVTAAPAKANSIESLLLAWSHRPDSMAHSSFFGEGEKGDADEPAREILRRGQKAVPDLLKLADDRRITAHEQGALGRAPLRVKRLGDLARELLREIAGGQASFPKYRERSPALRAWWEKVGGQDETDFLVQAVFTRKDGKITWVNETPAHMVADKFPGRLRALCEEFSNVAAPDTDPTALASVVATSSLPKPTRIQMLAQYAQRGPLRHRVPFLRSLADVDRDACMRFLIPLLKSLPPDATGEYWRCPEANLALLVTSLEDGAVWHEFLRAARRGSVGLRMEMISRMYDCYGKPDITRGHTFRLAFLAAFLDDDTMRHIPDADRVVGKFGGPCAAFCIPNIQVRDCAAMVIASILKLKESPDEFWTPSEWQSLRDKVRRKLAEKKLPRL